MIFYPRAESEKRPFPGNTRKHDASPSEKKTGNLIHRAEAWPLLKFIRLEYSTMNNLQYLVPFGPQGRCFRSNHRRCSVKKGVLRNFLENSQESTCARASFLIKLQAPATLLKKKLWHRCFPVNFAKFLRTPFSQSTSG